MLQTAWKKHQNTVYSVDIRLAQKKGLTFYQTRSNAIILYNTLPAYCIPKFIKMETGEIAYEKEYESPGPHPKIDFLERSLDEGIGFRSCWTSRKLPTNPTKPKSNSQNRADQLKQNKRPVRVLRKSTHVSHLTARVPIYLFLTSDKDKDTDENVDADRVRTGRQVGGQQCPQLEEVDIDFRVSGLPCAVVKQAENFRVRELVKKIDSHRHRQDLQADLQQSNAYNPF